MKVLRHRIFLRKEGSEMFASRKAVIGYKFLLPLFIVGIFAGNVKAATVVPVDWLNNSNGIITGLSSSNVYEYHSDHSVTNPIPGIDNPGIDRIRLDSGTLSNGVLLGYVSGTVNLPSSQAWHLNFYVSTDESADLDVATEYVKLSFNGNLISTLNNYPADTPTLISYDFYGDTLAYDFNFSSPSPFYHRHMIVEVGTFSAVPLPPSGVLSLFALPLVFWGTRRQKV